MEIDTEKIIVKNNPRKDFGNMDELVASVKEKGVIEPIVVKNLGNGNFELIAGERRLRAAKSAGLKTIPYCQYSEQNDTDIEEVKLVENMHRKGFNPVEEAEAFNQYLDITKQSIDTLAQKISKPKMYIQRRLELLALPDEITIALSEGKIQLGHALMLARIKNVSDQKKMFKMVVSEKMGVHEAEKNMRYADSSAQLKNSVFDTASCKGCRHNGGEQSLLFESGTGLKDLCLNKRCFISKTLAWKEQEIKNLKKDGVKVLSPTNLEKLKTKQHVSEYDDDYKSVVQKLSKEPENYAVVFDEDYRGVPIKHIYCTNPKARRAASRPQTVNDEKERLQNANDKLKSRVHEFRRNFLIEKSRQLIATGKKESKAMTLYSLLREGCDWKDRAKRDLTQDIIKSSKTGVEIYGCIEPNFSKILSLDENEIDRLITEVSSLWIKNLGNELQKASAVFGVDIKKHFVITEDYLKLHTKDQLISLAKEIGLDRHLDKKGIEKWDKAKRSELIDNFLDSGFDLKGKVPVIMKKGVANQ